MKAVVGVFLLMSVTAIVGGVVFYQFASDITERMKTTFPTQSLQIESFEFTDTRLRIYIKNYSSLDIQVTDVNVNGIVLESGTSVMITPSEVRVIDLPGSYSHGEACDVTVFSGVELPLVCQLEYK